MKIKEVKASVILNSRGEKTIEIAVNSNHCKASAPGGKSKGKHEKISYIKNDVYKDEEFINCMRRTLKKFPEINEFEDLEIIEKKLKSKIGANTLFALEASILKALADEKGIELWKLLNPNASVFPRIWSNIIGGGAHTDAKIKPDFQEFLVTCNRNPSLSEIVNRDAYIGAGVILKNLTTNTIRKNDENAWVTDEDNEKVLEIIKDIQEDVFDETGVHVDIGIDCAASQFFKNGSYFYKNRQAKRKRAEQIAYVIALAKKYRLSYIEDPLDEEDFEGFAELARNLDCIIVGDDLTVTNIERVEKAIKMGAVTGVIIKPNQTGSLIEAKKVVDACKRAGIRTIISHRSGETFDDTIADLAFAWQCDFIKIPVAGKERLAKIRRLIEIENSLKKREGSEQRFLKRYGMADADI